MRSRVTSVLLTAFLACVVAALGAAAHLQSNSCECPTPPGGSVSCPKDFIPVCIVRGGKVISSCAQIASYSGARTEDERAAVFLSGLLKRRVSAEDLSGDSLLGEIRREGGFAVGNVNLTFRLSGEEPRRHRAAELPKVADDRAARALNSFADARERGFAIVDFDDELERNPFLTLRPAESPTPIPSSSQTPTPAPTPRRTP